MKRKLKKALSLPLSIAMLCCMIPSTAMTISAAEPTQNSEENTGISVRGNTESGEPVWSWAEDHSTASAVFVGIDGQTETLDGDITVSLGDGTCTYTAAVTRNEQTYSDTVTIVDVDEQVLSKCEAYKKLADDSQKEIYRRLLTFAKSVVRGEQTSSVFSFSPDFRTEWTADDLGLDASATYGDGCNAVEAKVGEHFQETASNIQNVIPTLLADCPYEFYWYAKTVSSPIGMYSYSLSASIDYSGAWTIYINTGAPTFYVSMNVSKNYQNGTMTSLDRNAINTVKSMVPARAQSIVNQYAGESDYAKLRAYAMEIGKITNYNNPATGEDWDMSDSDPWQLVYVFDNNDDTTVVCEGYSKAFKYLCDLTEFNSPDIKCYLVSGRLGGFDQNDIFSSGKHMWNIVTMDDGNNYLVDVTNSDEYTNRENYNAFLLNGGSLDAGNWYHVTNRADDYDVLYFIYSDSTKTLWGNDILTLSEDNYEPCTVTFDANGGSAVSSQFVTCGNTVNEPEAPTRNGYTFNCWKNGDEPFSFNTPITEDITLTADWQENTVEITCTDINGIKTQKWDAGVATFNLADISLPSAYYLDGYSFEGWNVDGNIYKSEAAVKAALAVLVSPDRTESIDIKEVYQKIEITSTVTVTGGKLKGKNAVSGKYQASDLVSVVANTPDTGMKFAHWEKDGVIVGYDTTYTFRMPSRNTALEAVFVSDGTQQQKAGTAYIESVTVPTDGKLAFVAVCSVPKGYKMVKGGLVATNEDSIGASVSADAGHYKYLKISSKTTETTKSLKYTWTKTNISASETWYVKAYLVYEDTNGVQHTVYSNVVMANRSGMFS